MFSKLIYKHHQEKLILFIYFFIATYLSFFYQFNEFGLYEDDFASAHLYGNNLKEKFQLTKEIFTKFPMGRPITFFSLKVLTSIIFEFFGIKGLYLFCCLILSINAHLIYLILIRCGLDNICSILGALLFIFFPSDTLKMLIVRGFAVHLSILICLLATLLYLNNKKLTSYILFFVSLLTYENGIFIFLFASALKHKSLSIKNNFKHVLYVALTIILVILIRKYIGSGSRVQQFINLYDISNYIKFIYATVGGFIFSIKNFYEKLFLIFTNFKSWMYLPLVFFIISTIFIYVKYTNSQFKIEYTSALTLSLVGIFSWITGYLIMAGHRYDSIFVSYGRITSVHSASAFGFSIFFSSFIFFLKSKFPNSVIKNVSLVLTFLLCINLFLFGNVMQDKITQSWKNSKKLYYEVNKIEDWQDGNLILIPNYYNNNKFVLGTAWSTYLVLELIYKFPENWNNKPVIITPNSIFFKDGKYFYKNYKKTQIVDFDKIILLRHDKNKNFFREFGKNKIFIKNKIVLEIDVRNKGSKFNVQKNILNNFFTENK